jgi:hypothetical protein
VVRPDALDLEIRVVVCARRADDVVVVACPCAGLRERRGIASAEETGYSENVQLQIENAQVSTL